LEEGSNPRRPRPARYLLTQEQVDAFFQAAAVFDYPEPWQWQARAFFGLMAACGLRTCEARRLERADVDLAGRAVDVKWSKGPRSRRLFVNDQVAAMLEACDRRNGLFHPGRAWFFTTGWRNQVPPVAPGVLFNRLWSAAGLARAADGPAPGPYTFRHHFAYANIERWAARGEDVAAMMPYLMRYMGHSSIASTLYYTHVSPDFTARHAASHAASAALLPRVGFDV
jgi:integrase